MYKGFLFMVTPFVPLQHQVAGHNGSMQSVDGSLFCKAAKHREIKFYNDSHGKMMDPSDSLALGSLLIDWMPVYLGTLDPGLSDELSSKKSDIVDGNQNTLGKVGQNETFLVLENVLYGYRKPNIMDIKLGNILYDETADKAKVERMKEVSRSTTSGSLSFRICGVQISDDFHGELPASIENCKMEDVCHRKPDGYLTFDKRFGRSLTETSVRDALRLFFRGNCLAKVIQDKIVDNFVIRLQTLYNCLLDTEVRIISGSLLFVLEDDEQRWKDMEYEDPVLEERLIDDSDDEEEEEEEGGGGSIISSSLSCLKFIDFAHARYTPGEGYDEGLIKGVENLLKLMADI
ncbi:hypothetical protein FOA43_003812 [Brettanomyces nanus]|uniref:Kinase n=1 Tax=Eeniella nana TaxID=13502 RepID=A0A875S678_EENNA|nr:uncharacterized protein FOA43_003812 [Brettanomyces nanus]QPG76423.1 hypothetical protein FOA43_003812 [Brettanomyces nanus]